MPYFGNAPAFGDFPTASLVGNGGTTYTLPFVLPNENTALVFLNGAPQVPGENFSIVEDQLVFEGGVATGTQIYVHGLGIGKALLTPSDGATIATPVQFDASQKIVNAEFVKRALGNLNGANVYGSSQVLPVSVVGSWVAPSAAGITLTLPLSASVPNGSILNFYGNSVGLTVAKQGSDNIVLGASAIVPNVVLGVSDRLTLVSVGAGWYAICGDATLPQSSFFGSSLAASGYQKLPSGLIIQWGTLTQTTTANGIVAATVTLPIAFPNAVLCLTGNLKFNNDLNGGAPVNLDAISLSQISVSLDYTTSSEGTGVLRSVYWLAIGN